MDYTRYIVTIRGTAPDGSSHLVEQFESDAVLVAANTTGNTTRKVMLTCCNAVTLLATLHGLRDIDRKIVADHRELSLLDSLVAAPASASPCNWEEDADDDDTLC